VDVTISSEDSSFIEVLLRCLAVEGDGLGFHEANDGGLLATVMADGFKGYSSCLLLLPLRRFSLQGQYVHMYKTYGSLFLSFEWRV
jgi:hypothetical protein